MRLWIDCEFNGFRGELISMALVSEDGKEFYEVLPCDRPVPWVRDNVMTVLYRMPISKGAFTDRLYQFLNQFETIHVIADWPEDIKHFCEALITGPGTRINTPPLSLEVVRIDAESQCPHNALADARAIMDAHLTWELGSRT